MAINKKRPNGQAIEPGDKMNQLNKIPRSATASPEGFKRTSRSHKSGVQVPFMALLVGSVTAISVTAGVVNAHLERWAVAWFDLEQIEQVEFISARIDQE